MERWHVGGGSRGETLSHCLGRQMEQRKNNQNKINENTITNQKQVAVTEGSMEGICDKQDAWGKRDAIILGVL